MNEKRQQSADVIDNASAAWLPKEKELRGKQPSKTEEKKTRKAKFTRESRGVAVTTPQGERKGGKGGVAVTTPKGESRGVAVTTPQGERKGVKGGVAVTTPPRESRGVAVTTPQKERKGVKGGVAVTTPQGERRGVAVTTPQGERKGEKGGVAVTTPPRERRGKAVSDPQVGSRGVAVSTPQSDREKVAVSTSTPTAGRVGIDMGLPTPISINIEMDSESEEGMPSPQNITRGMPSPSRDSPILKKPQNSPGQTSYFFRTLPPNPKKRKVEETADSPNNSYAEAANSLPQGNYSLLEMSQSDREIVQGLWNRTTKTSTDRTRQAKASAKAAPNKAAGVGEASLLSRQHKKQSLNTETLGLKQMTQTEQGNEQAATKGKVNATRANEDAEATSAGNPMGKGANTKRRKGKRGKRGKKGPNKVANNTGNVESTSTTGTDNRHAVVSHDSKTNAHNQATPDKLVEFMCAALIKLGTHKDSDEGQNSPYSGS
ncbi:uncharacterized protein LOC124282510 [Haliotis rubra]|uniref:uncharacterized protein LOC124282510 n=1 Tax=Haliotis rubra TaxID=36100 RepID=UPI001EE57C9A|nr:uncharacterized protein LOC124282510 [Haliotis rubra]